MPEEIEGLYNEMERYLRLNELRIIISDFHLRRKGRKSELINRIITHLEFLRSDDDINGPYLQFKNALYEIINQRKKDILPIETSINESSNVPLNVTLPLPLPFPLPQSSNNNIINNHNIRQIPTYFQQLPTNYNNNNNNNVQTNLLTNNTSNYYNIPTYTQSNQNINNYSHHTNIQSNINLNSNLNQNIHPNIQSITNPKPNSNTSFLSYNNNNNIHDTNSMFTNIKSYPIKKSIYYKSPNENGETISHDIFCLCENRITYDLTPPERECFSCKLRFHRICYKIDIKGDWYCELCRSNLVDPYLIVVSTIDKPFFTSFIRKVKANTNNNNNGPVSARCVFSISETEYRQISSNHGTLPGQYDLQVKSFLLNDTNSDKYYNNLADGITWPEKTTIYVNGYKIPIIQRSVPGSCTVNKMLREKASSIFTFIKSGKNIVEITAQDTNRLYCFIFQIVRHQVTNDLINFIKNNSKAITLESAIETVQSTFKSSPDNIKNEKLENLDSDDDDIVTCSTILSLRCPLGLERIIIPARGLKCSHLQCFDLNTFLLFNKNAKSRAWKCIICHKFIPITELRIDPFMEQIIFDINKINNKKSDDDETEEIDEIEIFPDGNWKIKKKRNKDNNDCFNKENKNIRDTTVSVNDISNDNNINQAVIELDLSSDDETSKELIHTNEGGTIETNNEFTDKHTPITNDDITNEIDNTNNNNNNNDNNNNIIINNNCNFENNSSEIIAPLSPNNEDNTYRVQEEGFEYNHSNLSEYTGNIINNNYHLNESNTDAPGELSSFSLIPSHSNETEELMPDVWTEELNDNNISVSRTGSNSNNNRKRSHNETNNIAKPQEKDKTSLSPLHEMPPFPEDVFNTFRTAYKQKQYPNKRNYEKELIDGKARKKKRKIRRKGILKTVNQPKTARVIINLVDSSDEDS